MGSREDHTSMSSWVVGRPTLSVDAASGVDTQNLVCHSYSVACSSTGHLCLPLLPLPQCVVTGQLLMEEGNGSLLVSGQQPPTHLETPNRLGTH